MRLFRARRASAAMSNAKAVRPIRAEVWLKQLRNGSVPTYGTVPHRVSVFYCALCGSLVLDTFSERHDAFHGQVSRLWPSEGARDAL